jgi:hypothetical protein
MGDLWMVIYFMGQIGGTVGPLGVTTSFALAMISTARSRHTSIS